MTADKIIATIDFEASSLVRQGEPIEVGIALWDHSCPIRTWSSLIYPSSDILWSPDSAAVHGIKRWELNAAPRPAWVAEKLSALMERSPFAFCDGGESDLRWMWQLYSAGNANPAFRLLPFEAMPGLHIEAVRNRMWEFLETTKAPHRAGPDSVRLMHAYAYALGEEPVVLEDV
jgi:DNA polymerase III subunit epsilon